MKKDMKHVLARAFSEARFWKNQEFISETLTIRYQKQSKLFEDLRIYIPRVSLAKKKLEFLGNIKDPL